MALIRDEQIRLLGAVLEKDWTKFARLIAESNVSKEMKIQLQSEAMLMIHGDDLEAAARLRKLLIAVDD